MSLSHADIQKKHDKAFESHQVTRERASDDLVFYYITHWDDVHLQGSQLAYRGQFDMLKKAGRSTLAEMAGSPVQVDFEPRDEDRDDAGEFADTLYRADDNHNTSIEAYEVGKQEMVVCGFGAWEIYHKYVTPKGGDRTQVIRRKPVVEANNTVFFDPNSQLLDKSDAKYCSRLQAYSPEGYRDLVIDLTGEDPGEINPGDFKSPEHSYAFPWVGGEGDKIYVADFYYREKVKSKILTMADPLGETTEIAEKDLLNVMDDMIDVGYEIIAEKEVERWQVTKYIASGKDILSESVIAGEYIPIIPVYGEHAYIEGEEHYEGIVRIAKDPQRLRDFQGSYLADIVSQSPRQKPIYGKEQIAGFEYMYELSGPENNYPYMLQHLYDADGKQLPVGAVGITPEQKVPQSLLDCMIFARQAIEDVANPGLPQDIADPDMSGVALKRMEARYAQQNMLYQEHYKHAKRHDGQVWASMASEIYDTPRRVRTEMPDGTRKEVMVMEQVIDKETGDVKTLNDIRGVEFDVFSKIGVSYSSLKEQTIEMLKELMLGVEPGDPMRKVLMLKILKLMDGVDSADVRDYANKQLIIMGIREPETDEEIKMLQQHQQQSQQPDPATLLAQAEMIKGRADMLREQREGVKMQLDAQNERAKRKVDTFKAQTDRMNTMVDAQEAGANIKNKEVDTFGKHIENQAKIIDLNKYKNMSDDELFKSIMTG